MRKLVLYIACSVDGYIATQDDDLSFLERVQGFDEDYGYADFMKTIDTVIVGRRTYDWVINSGYEFPHKDLNCYIITRSERPSEGNLTFYNGSLPDLVALLKQQPGKDIFCDGGTQIVDLLLKSRLFDELILSIAPVLLGDGKRLFEDNRPMEDLRLIRSESYPSGLVQLQYSVEKHS